jgi:metallo-beta-lactamase family protein
MCAIAEYTRSVEQSKAVTASPYPKVVISASGMVTGGRVLHHLKALGGDRRNTILFAGFQAAGTRGRALLNGKREVKIHGEWIAIEAKIADLSQLSAHADSDELMRWLSGFKTTPKEVFVVHGEPDSSDALRVRIKRELGWNARAPRQDQVFEL